MIRIVREHNELSGYRFVIVEHVLVGSGLALLGVYYLAVGRLIDAFVWLGIVVNCGLIAVLAIGDLRAGAVDRGLLPLRHRAVREAFARDHPGLQRRTLVLIAVTFVPCLLALRVVLDGGRTG